MYLRYNRIFHWKVWQGLGSEKGVADIIGIKKVKVADLVKAGIKEIGQFMAIEVKTENGKLSKHQKNFLERVKEEGGSGLWPGLKWMYIKSLKMETNNEIRERIAKRLIKESIAFVRGSLIAVPAGVMIWILVVIGIYFFCTRVIYWLIQWLNTII